MREATILIEGARIALREEWRARYPRGFANSLIGKP